MAYSPNNPPIFVAALAGAQAAMVASGRQPGAPSAPNYASIATIAGAFAQGVDSAWGSSAQPTQLDVLGVEATAAALFQDRQPLLVDADVLATYLDSLATAAVALVRSTDTYLSDIGASSPVWPIGGGSGGGGAHSTAATALGPGEAYTMLSTQGIIYVQAGSLPSLPENPSVGVEYLIRVIAGVAESDPVQVSAGGDYLLEDPGAAELYTWAAEGSIKQSGVCNGWMFDGTQMNLTR